MNHCIALTWSYKWKFSHSNVIKIAFCSFEKVFAHTCCPLPHLALLTRSVQSQFFFFFLPPCVCFAYCCHLYWGKFTQLRRQRVLFAPCLYIAMICFALLHCLSFQNADKSGNILNRISCTFKLVPPFFLICGNRKWNYLSCCQLRTVPTIESLSKFYMQKADCTPLCPFAEWPSRWTNLTLRVCHSRIRTRLSSPTTNSWRRSGSTPRAARSTASWASAGLSYPFCDLRRILELPQQLWAALQRAVRRT